jgi:hypothetical protein
VLDIVDPAATIVTSLSNSWRVFVDPARFPPESARITNYPSAITGFGLTSANALPPSQ